MSNVGMQSDGGWYLSEEEAVERPASVATAGSLGLAALNAAPSDMAVVSSVGRGAGSHQHSAAEITGATGAGKAATRLSGLAPVPVQTVVMGGTGLNQAMQRVMVLQRHFHVASGARRHGCHEVEAGHDCQWVMAMHSSCQGQSAVSEAISA